MEDQRLVVPFVASGGRAHCGTPHVPAHTSIRPSFLIGARRGGGSLDIGLGSSAEEIAPLMPGDGMSKSQQSVIIM